MSWPDQPAIYEIDTAVWLNDLSRARGSSVSLADVSPAEWDAAAPPGIDAVWLMGVWERSPAGREIATADPELVESFRENLPDFTDADLLGSPYCVRDYVVDSRFGGSAGLADARNALARRGLRLVLDYVPNHVAPDHPWVTGRPSLFVNGTAEDLAADPEAWAPAGLHVLARGRDPYFPPWPDVLQLDAFSEELREATAATLAKIASQCDGVRCDMAMLMINRIFGKTWGPWCRQPEPPAEFWTTVLGRLRAGHPETVFFAEAYWDLEWELQQQGFDFCYDKRLYDRLLAGDGPGVKAHLHAGIDYQRGLVRFLENHDEPRVASRIPLAAARADAVIVATLPGAPLWYEGQFEGRRIRPSVFLGRRSDEPRDLELAAWYHRLLAIVADTPVRNGAWELLEVGGWPDNQSCRNLLAWSWRAPDSEKGYVTVVDISGAPAQGRVAIPWTDVRGGPWRLRDLLSDQTFDRDGDELAGPGLYVALEAYGCYLFEVS